MSASVVSSMCVVVMTVSTSPGLRTQRRLRQDAGATGRTTLASRLVRATRSGHRLKRSAERHFAAEQRPASGCEQNLSGGTTSGEVVVCCGGVGEPVGGTDAHPQRAVGDPAEQLVGTGHQLVPGDDVVTQCGTGEIERPAG